MNASKRMKMLGSFSLIVAVSLATNFTVNSLSKKHVNNFKDDVSSIPAEYAKFSQAGSSIETDFTLAAELSVHAVVHIKTKTPAQTLQYETPFQNDPFFDFFFGQPNQRQQQRRSQEIPMREASGSGVIISPDGYIVTNNHVVDKAKEIEVTLNDKRTFKAKLVGTDPNTDIALIKVEAEKLPVILFGNSDSLKVGQWVLAVGNPFNLTSTVTAGIVSAKARSIDIINAPLKIESFIQTDAAINPGNSGGALVNTKGELIGINTAIASQTGSYAGYGFAVPVSIVKKVVADIRRYGVVQRAMLGVHMGDITSELAKEKKLKTLEGAYVSEVTENSAAEKAGVKEGDVINNVNGTPVKSAAELQEQIGRYSPGDKVTISVVRGNDEKKLNVILKNTLGNTGIVSSKNSTDVLGATYKPISEKIREQFNLDSGIEIKSLTKGKFADAGIKPGYIILKINNQVIRSEADIQQAFDDVTNNGQAEKVFYIAGIYQNGKVTYYAVNLADEK